MKRQPGRPTTIHTPPVPPDGSWLTVLHYMFNVNATPHSGGYQIWMCKCKCGEKTAVMRNRIVCGTTKSCGCLRSQMGKRKIEKARAVHVEQAKQRRLQNAQ